MLNVSNNPLYWVSLYWMPLCWVSLCWMSLCWMSLCWMSLCWMSFCECHFVNVIMLNVSNNPLYWVSLCWMPLCWVSWRGLIHHENKINVDCRYTVEFQPRFVINLREKTLTSKTTKIIFSVSFSAAKILTDWCLNDCLSLHSK